jgi:hypothetical protein
MLTARVGRVCKALRTSPDAIDAKIRVDADVVRPYMDRIEAAMKAP